MALATESRTPPTTRTAPLHNNHVAPKSCRPSFTLPARSILDNRFQVIRAFIPLLLCHGYSWFVVLDNEPNFPFPPFPQQLMCHEEYCHIFSPPFPPENIATCVVMKAPLFLTDGDPK
ncbi:hypothetical protein BDU57DRAFT_519908 [Ampelomyces quisqualis]|uniref:Uncharacterized protein n=1 Tax=Ampelomyces quisqualis TaxID=50730 RepID=A0A6A5QIS8_AMPQU|nr:hypothetical protein BDU57DRAFT_519908 [Ampelomyces quisqualis]